MSLVEATAVGDALVQAITEHTFVFRIDEIRTTVTLVVTMIQRSHQRAGDLVRQAGLELDAAKGRAAIHASVDLTRS